MHVIILLLLSVAYMAALFNLRNRELRRSGISICLIVGAVLGCMRITFLWLTYLRPGIASLQFLISYVLLPEGSILYVLHFRNETLHMVVFTLVLALGSLVWASPLLLIGSRKKA